MTLLLDQWGFWEENACNKFTLDFTNNADIPIVTKDNRSIFKWIFQQE